jgi:hypothetical protein
MRKRQNISGVRAWLLAMTMATMAMPASGGPILIFNTGVVSLNPVTLAADGAVDLHYNLIVSADAGAPGPNAYVAGPNGVYPIPPWLLNGSDSKWISPRVNSAANEPVGTYTYRTTFDLSGLDASSAVLTGRWAADNTGTLMLNGNMLGITSGGFDAWSPFTISSGFVGGVNTLDFVVTNVPGFIGPSPTGLRVEITGNATTTIPEPSTYLLVGLTLCGIAGYVKLRTRLRTPRRTSGLSRS